MPKWGITVQREEVARDVLDIRSTRREDSSLRTLIVGAFLSPTLSVRSRVEIWTFQDPNSERVRKTKKITKSVNFLLSIGLQNSVGRDQSVMLVMLVMISPQ